VCARGDFDAARDYYGPDFIDHVNEMEYRGQESIRQSVGLYLLVFTDLRIRVEDQIAEGDRVVSRWTAEGTNRGRHIRLPGITISQIADGKIVEDWTSSDNLGLLRQLGLGRTLLLSVDWLVAEVKRRR
jgi:predicted ester cyclase